MRSGRTWLGSALAYGFRRQGRKALGTLPKAKAMFTLVQRFLVAIMNAAIWPSLLLLLLSVVGLVLLLTSHDGAQPILLVSVGGQTALLLLPVPQWMARPLENRYLPLRPEPPHIDGIVTLGGAMRMSVAADRGTPGLNLEAERMTAFMALAQRHPEAKLVFAGGARHRGETEADAARRLFDSFGLAGRLYYEHCSQNTWQNAVFAHAVAKPALGETWVLVTSALHMPRAVAVFRSAGWQVLPCPVAYRTAHHGGDDWWAPNLAYRFELLDTAAHEWIGLALYKIRGRTVPGRQLAAAPALGGPAELSNSVSDPLRVNRCNHHP